MRTALALTALLLTAPAYGEICEYKRVMRHEGFRTIPGGVAYADFDRDGQEEEYLLNIIKETSTERTIVVDKLLERYEDGAFYERLTTRTIPNTHGCLTLANIANNLVILSPERAYVQKDGDTFISATKVLAIIKNPQKP